MTLEQCTQLDIEKLTCSISDENGKLVTDDFSAEMLENITAEIANKHPYKTGMYTPTIIEEKVEAYLKDYQQIIYITSNTPYTGQYEATKFLQEKHPERVFIVDSKCICTFHEEMTYQIIDYFKDHETIDSATLQKITDDVFNTGCMVFVPQSIDGIMYSGRIPTTLVKLLKLAKISPIIRVDDKNKPAKVIKHKTLVQDVCKMFNVVADIFKNNLNEKIIKKIYIIHTVVNQTTLKEIIKCACEFFKVQMDKIQVRLTPLPIATYTLKDSLAISLFTDNVEKAK